MTFLYTYCLSHIIVHFPGGKKREKKEAINKTAAGEGIFLDKLEANI